MTLTLSAGPCKSDLDIVGKSDVKGYYSFSFVFVCSLQPVRHRDETSVDSRVARATREVFPGGSPV